MPRTEVTISKNQFRIVSLYLKREVLIDTILSERRNNNSELPVILMNDGQDFDALGLSETLKEYSKENQAEFLFVGIHSSKDRLQEYGVSGFPDYAKRGSKARQYSDFVLKELIPFLKLHYTIKVSGHTIFGFSLGGLSALDIAIDHQEVFDKAGVFSGAFWWRSRDLGPTYTDEHDRIMHEKLKESLVRADLGFWFECGTLDENSDRNQNGVIDSIDDTLDIITILKNKGLKNITYREVKNGKHNPETWKKAIPEFLLWLNK